LKFRASPDFHIKKPILSYKVISNTTKPAMIKSNQSKRGGQSRTKIKLWYELCICNYTPELDCCIIMLCCRR
jgi:hypothetical protein